MATTSAARRTPPVLWSRGWHRLEAGGWEARAYRGLPTERRSRDLRWLCGAQGLVWLRLGSPSSYADRFDVVTFVEQVLATLSGPTVLVTTDGDCTVPDDLPPACVEAILESASIRGWFSQNLGPGGTHPKLHPLPIGLDLHTGRGACGRWRALLPASEWSIYRRIARRRARALPAEERDPRVWCDAHFASHPGRHGDPRGQLTRLLPGLTTAVAPARRVSQAEAWRRYARHRFVVSAPGNGLDTHRTWEALYLGAAVITSHSSIDSLLEPWRVAFVCDWKNLGDRRWLEDAWGRVVNRPVPDLSPEPWERQMRSLLAEA